MIFPTKFMPNLMGKKIMLAGSNGYIGTELANQLELNNIDYIGIDKTPTNKNNYGTIYTKNIFRHK